MHQGQNEWFEEYFFFVLLPKNILEVSTLKLHGSVSSWIRKCEYISNINTILQWHVLVCNIYIYIYMLQTSTCHCNMVLMFDIYSHFLIQELTLPCSFRVETSKIFLGNSTKKKYSSNHSFWPWCIYISRI